MIALFIYLKHNTQFYCMQIREIYDINHSHGGFGLASPREYIDLRNKSNKSLPVKTKKRETYFADIEKQSKKIPGPGKYQPNPEDKKYAKKVYKRIDFNAQAKKPRRDYIEQVIKEKKGIPGVGKYELVLQKGEKIREWHSILGDKARKKAGIFKSTIFDDCHVDCINVAPGSYNTQTSMVKVNKFQATAPPPKVESTQVEKKPSKSLPKLPGAQTYRPIPSEFDTFEKMLSRRKHDANHPNFAKRKRFSAEKELSPGPKYSLIAEWSPKHNGLSSKKTQNIFKSMSNLRAPGIYH